MSVIRLRMIDEDKHPTGTHGSYWQLELRQSCQRVSVGNTGQCELCCV